MENTTINQMKQSFQDGVDSIYNALVGQGTTPSGKTPAQLVASIGTLATNKYNAGNSAGYTSGYNAGIVSAKVDSKIFTKTTKFGYSTYCEKGDIVAMATSGSGLDWDMSNVTVIWDGVFSSSTMTLYRVKENGTVSCRFTAGSDYSWVLVRLWS